MKRFLYLLLPFVSLLIGICFVRSYHLNQPNQSSISAFVLPHNPLLLAQVSRLLSTSAKPAKIDLIIIFAPNHKDLGPLIIGSANDDQGLISQEHGVQVIKPLLEEKFPQAKIIPFIFRRGLKEREIANFISQLKKQIKNQSALVVGSIDFSHYLNQEKAELNDQETLRAIKNFNYQKILSFGPEHLDCPACLVIILRLLEEQNKRLTLLKRLYFSGTSYLILSSQVTTRPSSSPSPKPTSYYLSIHNNSKEGSRNITLAFVGDVGLGREINWQINQRNDPTFPFQKTAEILKKADLAIGNLEGPLVENCPLLRTGMKFCGNPKNAEGLVFAGFDLMNLANNHISNYGPEGINQTIKTLKNHQIDYFDPEKIAFKKIDGLTIAFLGFDDIVRRVDEEKLVQKIQEAKNQADLVIVNFHWGVEYQSQPNERQRYLAHLAIDHGADLIIGHHPHILQPIEYYQAKPILYSLGNFVFDQMWSQETRTGAIALITIESNQIKEVSLVPTLIRYSCQPQPITGPEKVKIINQIIKSNETN